MALLSGLGASDPCDLSDDAWVVLEFTPEKFAGVKAGPRGQSPIPFPSPLLFVVVTGTKARAWCLRIHAETYPPLSPLGFSCLPRSCIWVILHSSMTKCVKPLRH